MDDLNTGLSLDSNVGHPIVHTFDRAQMAQEGDRVKNDVLKCLFGAHGISLLPEELGEFLCTAFRCYGDVVRAQLLENVSGYLVAGQLTEDKINKTILYLATDLDRESAKLAKQVELITEVANAPKLKN